ncbi:MULTISPECIES: low temperature requirement protein A [Arthrobacter]|uniref:Low temperature requirement protein A n=2 Tax=Arthrobacter TaxID=1663 RepID=A0ABU9KJI8_9MICC|nr:low temperature requirement protein A [Arthrobacter sp. YJM1]MDP5226759.1 low temperature requirement protein A [Arthrobacter sp. YJM1]
MTAEQLGLRPMRARDPREAFRAASPLELFFDLVFVVAVSTVSGQLHHFYAAGEAAAGVGVYAMVFCGIWWAWMNFTWFATSFDTDDWLYRVLTILQMGGALVMTAGIAQAMEHQDFLVMTLGYVIMRISMVLQWLRAAFSDPALRSTALRYAGGITLVQVFWVARLALPGQGGIPVFLILMAAEVMVPVLAELSRNTPWHPQHIAERYGCFTLIVLGESILASTTAVIDAAGHQNRSEALLPLAGCALVLAAGMWWVYFSREHHEHFGNMRDGLMFGYGHYVIFAVAASFSAGIEVAIDVVSGESALSTAAAAATLTVPVALFLATTWFITLRKSLPRNLSVAFLGLTAALAACALVPGETTVGATVAAAVVMVLLVVLLELPSTVAASRGED